MQTMEQISPMYSVRVRFTGKGSEYFSIWISNLLLTVITLSIYSAWAKVRRVRWFAQHTMLLGDRFDYHGTPLRVLFGRMIALSFFGLYHLVTIWSSKAGLLVLGLLFFIGPWLLAMGWRFQLVNTRWRELHFDFKFQWRALYQASFPVMLIIIVPLFLGLLTEVSKSTQTEDEKKGLALAIISVPVIFWFLWPLAKAPLIQFRQRGTYYGSQSFEFGSILKALCLLQLMLLGISMLASVLIGIFFVWDMYGLDLLKAKLDIWAAVMPLLLKSLLVFFLFAMIIWAVSKAQAEQALWRQTRWRTVRFHSEIRVWRLFFLGLKNIIFILLSFGLYWPFAQVALARYRIESIVLTSEMDWPDLLTFAMEDSANVNATGDALSDFMSLDIGL